jgi:uncharacterized protein YjbI with pentapeptide repeats
MGFFDLFTAPKPMPSVVLKNVLGEVLLEIPGRCDLIGATLQGLNLAHVDLSGLSLSGANLEGANLFGARLVRTSFYRANLRRAEISFGDATGADFRHADLTDVAMYHTEIRSARFENSLLSELSDIPGRKVLAAIRVIA